MICVDSNGWIERFADGRNAVLIFAIFAGEIFARFADE